MSILERPALHEYAATCNDLGDSEVRKHQEETPAKTRHPDDCGATQTGSFRGWKGVRRLPPTRFRLTLEPRSVGDRSSWGRPCALKAALRLESIRPSSPRRASTARPPRAFDTVKRVGIVVSRCAPRLRVGPVACHDHFSLEGRTAPSEGGRDITARANRARRTTSAFDRFREPDDQTAAARREGPS